MPSKHMMIKPNNIEDLYLINNKDHKLHAWYYNSNNDKTLLYCHGNAGNISNRIHILKKCIDANISILLFDYRGYGLSQGYTTMESTYQDSVDWMNYLIDNKNISKNNIIPMGESIGSYPAAKIASEHNLPKVIIFAGFHSVSDVVISLFPKPLNYIISYITKGDLETGKYLEKHTGNKLILHSLIDEIISYDNAILNSLYYGSKLIKITGFHNDHNVDYNLIKEFIN